MADPKSERDQETGWDVKNKCGVKYKLSLLKSSEDATYQPKRSSDLPTSEINITRQHTAITSQLLWGLP